MSDAYRDLNEGLLAKNKALQDELAERDRRIEALQKRLGDQEAVFQRLEHALDAKGGAPPKRKRRRALLAGALVATALAAIGGVALGGRAKPSLPKAETNAAP